MEAACKRFEDLGVQFVKKPNDGRMKGLAFIKVRKVASVFPADCQDQIFVSCRHRSVWQGEDDPFTLQDPDSYWIEIFNGTASRSLVE